MPKQLSGYLDNGHGEPLADIPAVATILGTSTVVDTTLTDEDGHWLFTDLPTADEYVVTLTDTSGNAVARSVWSGEMRELWVSTRLDVGGLPLTLDPAVDNALAWSATGLYVPPIADVSDFYTKIESDARYEPLDSAYTKAEADALFLTAAEADVLFLTPAEGDAAYSTTAHNHAATYVDVGGDTMTGGLTISAGGIAVTGASTFSVAPTVGGSALLTATAADTLFLTPAEGNTAYATAAHNHDTTYVQLTGGSVMTGLLGPSTHNTRDLGTTGTRWRALYGMTGDFTTSLTVATKPLVVSPTGGNVLTWDATGLYVPTGGGGGVDLATGNATWVNVTGDTMTNTLTISNGALALTAANPIMELGQVGTANTPGIDFHSSANSHDYDVRVWASGGTASIGQGTLTVVAATLAVSGAITSAGSALMTQSASDTRYVNVAGDTMSAGLTISSGDLTLTAGRLYINQANAGLEFGASGTANTPFFDFHSGAVGVDYDTRLLGSGGTGVNGGGLLTLEGRFTVTAATTLNTTLTVGGTLGVTGATTLTGALQVNNTLGVTGDLTLTTGSLVQSSSAQTTNTLTQATADGLGPRTNYRKSRGSIGVPNIVTDGDILGDIAFYGWDGNSYEAAALIRCQVNGVAADGDMPGVLRFYTTADGGVTISQRMAIEQSGLVYMYNGLTVSAGGAAITGNSTLTGKLSVTPGSGAGSNAITITEPGTTDVSLGFANSGVPRTFLVGVEGSRGAPTVGPAGAFFIHDTTAGTSRLTITTAGVVNVLAGLNVTGNLGFYGTTGIAKPTVTGSRGANAALTSLLTALASLGLVVNSSS